MGNKRSSHSSEEKENKDKEEQNRGKQKRDQPNNDSKAQKPKPDAVSPSDPPDRGGQTQPAASPTLQPASPAASIKPDQRKDSIGGPKPPDLSNFAEDTKNLLLGKFENVNCRLRPQVIRIYVSASTVGELPIWSKM